MNIDYDAINDDIAKAIRNMAIEECAQVVDHLDINDAAYFKPHQIANAIRALKERP